MEETRQNLAGLFLEHAGGMVTLRALRERQIRILNYLGENKYTIRPETFQELHAELDGIERQIEEASHGTQK